MPLEKILPLYNFFRSLKHEVADNDKYFTNLLSNFCYNILIKITLVQGGYIYTYMAFYLFDVIG